ncbi:MAG TPA: DUF2569 family protein [Reyranella sp.]|jgi:hypothetical protein|nr:DUF2569 family protein [Reyranella sp.]
MDKGSVWHWLVALVVFCVPILLLVRYRQPRTAAVAKAPPKGIGGWLALFAFLLCLGFMRSVAELVLGLPDYWAGFRNEAAHGPLVAVGLLALAAVAVHLWAIVALFRKKKAFRTACVALWGLMLATQLALLSMLTVPGVTLEMILPDAEIALSIAALAFMGVWCWYLSVSVRVKNTFVN